MFFWGRVVRCSEGVVMLDERRKKVSRCLMGRVCSFTVWNVVGVFL